MQQREPAEPAAERVRVRAVLAAELGDEVGDEVLRLREMSPLWEMVQEGVDLSQVKWTMH